MATYKVEDDIFADIHDKWRLNYFLCIKKYYANLELELEVKLNMWIKSGIQICSISLWDYKNGHIYGYQIEIIADENADFIYDESIFLCKKL